MKKYIAVLLIFMIILLAMWQASPVKKISERELVSVYECGYKNISTSAFFTGNIVNSAETAISLANTTQISDIFVKIGDEVTVGDQLFKGKVIDYDLGVTVSKDIISALKSLVGNSVNTENVTYTASKNDDFIIKSPKNGVVTAINIATNSIIGADIPCMIIADTSKLQVRAEVPEEYIQDISLGMSCKINGNAFKNKKYSGKIVQIMPYATTSSMLTGNGETVVEILISIEDADEILKAGYSARAEVCTRSIKYTITIPYNAIQQDENGTEYVYLYKNNTAVRQNITTDIELTDTVQITSGLNIGDMVILNSKDIENGMGVKLNEDKVF